MTQNRLQVRVDCAPAPKDKTTYGHLSVPSVCVMWRSQWQRGFIAASAESDASSEMNVSRLNNFNTQHILFCKICFSLRWTNSTFFYIPAPIIARRILDDTAFPFETKLDLSLCLRSFRSSLSYTSKQRHILFMFMLFLVFISLSWEKI